MTILALLLSLLPAAPAAAAGPGPHYVVAVQNGAYNFTGGEAAMAESWRALAAMVKLAGEKRVRLTLLFSAQYAAFVASDTARLSEALTWVREGHEFGAYHVGPESQAWDGYSDLGEEELKKLRGGARLAGGHEDFLKALALLGPLPKASCLQGSSDKTFVAAMPGRELCLGSAREAASGANEFMQVSAAAPERRLGSFRPADKAGVEGARVAFASMDIGVYAAVFRSNPSEFGAFYAWVDFLSKRDPQGLRSRTASGVFDGKLLEERKTARAKKGRPPAAEKTALPLPPSLPAELAELAGPAEPARKRLQPLPSIFGKPGAGSGPRMAPGRCGDGICDVFERRMPGRCQVDCGN